MNNSFEISEQRRRSLMAIFLLSTILNFFFCVLCVVFGSVEPWRLRLAASICLIGPFVLISQMIFWIVAVAREVRKKK